jgi:transposase
MGTYSPTVIEAVPAGQTGSTKTRQHRSLELKRQIVEETLVAGASVARIARTHGVNANQVFYWRQLYHAGRLGNPPTKATPLLPVTVAQTPREATTPPVLGPSQGGGNEAGKTGSIQLELRKARVHIEGNIDLAVLRLVLQAVLR